MLRKEVLLIIEETMKNERSLKNETLHYVK